MTDVTQPATSP